MYGHLLDNVKITRCSNAVAVGTADVTGSTIDMAGFDGVVFIALMGAITDGGAILKVQSGAAANMSDAADLTGTGVTLGNGDDNEDIAVDVFRPAERYVRAILDLGGATGAVVNGILALQYRAKNIPVTQPATTNYETWSSPAEGTA